MDLYVKHIENRKQQDTLLSAYQFTANFKNQHCQTLKIIINFAGADRYAEARSGVERREADIMKSVY